MWFARSIAFVAALLVAGATASLPGYFAGDELQWGARAAAGWSAAPWVSPDFSDFQFRPLTFNLWLAMSQVLFPHPRLFHWVYMALGVGIALLLYRCVTAAGQPAQVGTLTAAAFVVMPSSAFTHAWLGTLADLAWVACALTTVMLVARKDSRMTVRGAAIAGLLLTATALAAKETAVCIPLLLGACYLLLPRAPVFAAAMGSAAAALVYLLLRWDALTRGDDATYVMDPALLPVQALKYVAWPFAWKNQELHNLFYLGWDDVVLALAMHAALIGLALRLSRRVTAAYLLAYFAAVVPVLVIPNAYPHYLYASGAAMAALLAWLWHRYKTWGRVVMTLPILALAIHAARIVNNFQDVARHERALTASIASELASPTSGPIRLEAPTLEVFDWTRRLLANVPGVRGAAIDRSVHLCWQQRCVDAITGTSITP